MITNVLFDYLKATFTLPELTEYVYPDDCTFYVDLIDLLCVDKEYIESKDGAMHGYNHTIHVGENIKIYMTGPKTKNGFPTHLLEMTGKGCREFDSYGGDWIKLLSHLVDYGCNITRLDIANDLIDYHPITMNMILAKIENDEYSTPRHRNRQIIRSGKVKSSANPGTSITFGTRKSSSVLQIYDKKAERQAKNIMVDCSSWIRFELRLYTDKALVFILECLIGYREKNRTLPELFSGVLSDFITFLEPPEIDNTKVIQVIPEKRSWKTCAWWDEYIGNVEKIRIKNQYQLESSITDNIDWLHKSVAKLLMRVSSSLRPNEMGLLLKDMLSIKVSELTKKDLSKVNTHRRLIGLNKLTYNEMINTILDVGKQLEEGLSNETK